MLRAGTAGRPPACLRRDRARGGRRRRRARRERRAVGARPGSRGRGARGERAPACGVPSSWRRAMPQARSCRCAGRPRRGARSRRRTKPRGCGCWWRRPAEPSRMRTPPRWSWTRPARCVRAAGGDADTLTGWSRSRPPPRPASKHGPQPPRSSRCCGWSAPGTRTRDSVRLGLSERTVERHLSNIFTKLGSGRERPPPPAVPAPAALTRPRCGWNHPSRVPRPDCWSSPDAGTESPAYVGLRRIRRKTPRAKEPQQCRRDRKRQHPKRVSLRRSRREARAPRGRLLGLLRGPQRLRRSGRASSPGPAGISVRSLAGAT